MVDTLILDLLDPEKARRPPMAMKGYSAELKADAVALYESVKSRWNRSGTWEAAGSGRVVPTRLRRRMAVMANVRMTRAPRFGRYP
ncbi:hypothetical protein [Streptomyces sp. NPDC053431]|uniref:hypothetical protein n=1 Tax=Streptomyces sp. NPDC053431 TaxID=3365703 RepID=UPI0037D8D1A0